MSDQAPTEINSDVIELAKYLAINAFSHSVDDPNGAGTSPVFKLGEPDNKYALSRNILIVGAGVSFNANPAIPLASTFGDKLIKKFEGQFKKKGFLSQNLLQRELDFLARAYGLNREEFETKMLACSHFDNQKVLDILKTKYDLRHVPNLFFEIAAHLFKHRFIDVIIDFNFDEILTNAIEDEMKEPEYHYVLSDGDIDDELDNIMINHRLKRPIYIKPHGTISHPSSMRFDRKQYFHLPQKIADLLKVLFEARYTKDPHDHLHLNIISTGFGMQSIDLNYILKKALQVRTGKAGCNFYVFDAAPETTYFENLKSNGFFKDVGIDEAKTPKHKFAEKLAYIEIDKNPVPLDTSNSDVENNGLESYFYRLWVSIFHQFSSKKVVRNIRRHLILAQIFQNKNSKPIKLFKSKDVANEPRAAESEFYLIAKIYVEMALLLVHADGLININQLKESTLNKYYNLLLQLYTAFETNDPQIAPRRKRMDIHCFITAFEMVNYKSFAKDTFIYEAIYEKKDESAYQECIIVKLLSLLGELKVDFHPKNILNNNIFDQVGKKTLQTHFRYFGKNPVWHIKSNFQEYGLTKFNTVDYKSLLHTDLRYNNHLNEYLRDPKSNVVLSVTKSSKFLLGDFYHDKEQDTSGDHKFKDVFKKNGGHKHMFLIMATSDIPKIEDYIDKNISRRIEPFDEYSIIIARLHWTLHNQHLHLFLRIDNSSIRSFEKIVAELEPTDKADINSLMRINQDFNRLINFNDGIYYHRRMLSRKINPIYISSSDSRKDEELIKNDLIELLDIFVNYWARCGTSNQGEEPRSSHAVLDYKDFLTYKSLLLRKIFDQL